MLVPTYAELCERTDGPKGSSWGVFGDEDEYGTLNFLTPERVAAAASCIRRGAVFGLDYPLDAFPGPLRFRDLHEHVIFSLVREDDEWKRTHVPGLMFDDYVDHLYMQASSHIDGYRHVVHPEHGLYNGGTVDEVALGSPRLGVGRWAERGISGRGILIDVARYGESIGRPLDHGASESFGAETLNEALAAQGTTVQPGDMVLLRTGAPSHLWKHADDDEVAVRTAGLAQEKSSVAWLWDNQISLIAADNIGVESTGGEPAPDEVRLHPQLIPLLGMVVGELWKLDELAADCAADGVYEFFLTVKPLNLTGGVGSPANATAIK
jgi:hypothetical protein